MPGGISLEIKGVPEMKAKLKRLVDTYAEASAAALYMMGLRALAIAIRKTPVDTGRLRATNYCAPPEVAQGGMMTVTLGFGTAYGIYVHERTDLKHTSGEAKFLQKALDEIAAGYLPTIARLIKANAEQGVGLRAVDAGGVPTTPLAASIPWAHHQAKKENARQNRNARARAVRASKKKG
jgi:hypothetical protein